MSFAPSAFASSRLSSPPLTVQALRPSTFAPEKFPETPKYLPEEASSSLPVAPSKLSTSASTESSSRLAAGSSSPSVSSSSESSAHQTKSVLPPTASGPSRTICPPALVSISSYAAPITSPEKHIVRGSKVPCFPDAPGGPREKPAPPRLIPTTSSVSTKFTSLRVAPAPMSKSGSSTSTLPGSCLSTSASPASLTPSAGSKVSEPAPSSWCQTYTPPGFGAGLSAASAPPGLVASPRSATQDSPTVRPLFTLPPRTTQASRTVPVSNPPALVSVPPVIVKSSRALHSSDFKQHLLNAVTPPVQKQSPPKLEHHGLCTDRKTVEHKINEKAEEHVPQLDSGVIRTSQVEPTEAKTSETGSYKLLPDLPGKSSQTTDHLGTNLENTPSVSEKHPVKIGVVSDSSGESASPVKSSRLPRVSDEQCFDNSHAAFYYKDSSTCDTPSRLNTSSVLEKTSLLSGDSLFLGDSTQFDTSQFDSTSCNSTRESSFSVDESRDDTLDSTREGEPCESERTGSSQLTGGSMLESSLNISHTEEPPIHSSGVSHSFVSPQPVHQGAVFKFFFITHLVVF